MQRLPSMSFARQSSIFSVKKELSPAKYKSFTFSRDLSLSLSKSAAGVFNPKRVIV